MMLRSLFDRTSVEARELKPWGDWSSQSVSHAGVNVTPDSALHLLAVYGCVRLISDTIATLPIDVFRRTAGDKVETNAPRWLDQPNESTDVVEFLTMVLSSLLLDGNAYITYTLDASFVTQSLQAIHPQRVQIQPGPDYFIDGVRVNGRLIHVKGVTRPGALAGLSPVEAAKEGIGLGLAAQEFGARFFGDGANMSGVIEMPKGLSPDAAKILSQRWGADHHGLKNAHKPGVLTEGAQWKPISVTNEQAQFLETRKFTAAEIAAQMFLVDPTLLGIPVDGKSLTYANLEQRGIHLVQFTLLPWIVRLERMFNRLLPRVQFAKFNVGGLQRADMKTRYEAYAIGTAGAPFLLQDEAREKEDLPLGVEFPSSPQEPV